MKTFRRDRLLRLVQAGKVELLSSYHFDDTMGETGKKGGEARPVAMMPNDRQARQEGTAYLTEFDFTSRSGRCWYEDEAQRIVCLYVHSNCSYTLRINR